MAQKDGQDPQETVGNVYLTGFMCAGKSSVGRLLAKKLGRRFADSDAAVERRAGRTIAAVVKSGGLKAFRKLENAEVKKIAARANQVVALGGGVYPSGKWRSLLARTGVTVFLNCRWPELERRLKKAAGPRPLLAGPWPAAAARAKNLYARRLPFYRLAAVTVDTSGIAPALAAKLIQEKYEKL
jgi:shikimate kinase